MNRHTATGRIRRCAAIIMTAMLAMAVITPMPATAATRIDKNNKTVRVGWYESSFNTKDSSGLNAAAANPWEEVHITMGLSEYSPDEDRAVIDTVRRADKIMYINKRAKKVDR